MPETDDADIRLIKGFTITNFVIMLIMLVLLFVITWRLFRETNSLKQNISGWGDKIRDAGAAALGAYLNM